MISVVPILRLKLCMHATFPFHLILLDFVTLAMYGEEYKWWRSTLRGFLQSPVASTCFHAGFLLSLFFLPWRWRRYVPPKRRLTLNGLHGVIFQKKALFIVTAVRTSNPTLTKYDLNVTQSKQPLHSDRLRQKLYPTGLPCTTWDRNLLSRLQRQAAHYHSLGL
jgi:hypothetical protein